MSKLYPSTEQLRELAKLESLLTRFDKGGCIAHIVRTGDKLLVCSNFGWVMVKAKNAQAMEFTTAVVLRAKGNDGTNLLTYSAILQYLKQCDEPYLPAASSAATSGEPK